MGSIREARFSGVIWLPLDKSRRSEEIPATAKLLSRFGGPLRSLSATRRGSARYRRNIFRIENRDLQTCGEVPRPKGESADGKKTCQPTHNQIGQKITPGKKRHRSDTKDEPRRSHTERVEGRRLGRLIGRESMARKDALTKSRLCDIC